MTTQVIEVQVPGVQGPPGNAAMGWADYNDAATAVTPLTLTAGVEAVVPNDTLGPQTKRDYLPAGVSDVWDPVTNQFDFSQLNNGDVVHLRFDAELTTSGPNQLFRLIFVGGIGGFEYEVVMASGTVKNAGAVDVSRFNAVYIGDDNTRLNPAELRIVTDDDATVVVKGWFCEIIRR